MSISFVSRYLSTAIRTKNPRFYFTTSAITNSVEKYWAQLQSNDPNIEKTLTRVGAKLDSSIVKEVIRRCNSNNHCSTLGLRFFVWAGIQREYRHNSYMYNLACKLLRVNQNPNLIRDVIEAYAVDNCVVNVKTFKVVLNVCKEASLANEGLWVLKKMEDFNCRPDTTAYNLVIRLFCERSEMDEAVRLMEEMSSSDVVYPDMVTFVAMVKGFCDLGRTEDAKNLFEVVRRQGCTLNVVAYSTLLDGICRFGKIDEGLKLLDEMETKGGVCAPTVVTYTSMIRSFCDNGRSLEAFAILDRMEACGCAPNRVTISTFINGLCKEGRVEEAYKLIDRVVAGGSVTKSECFSSLVVTLFRVGSYEDGEKLFRRMLVSGLKPDGLACSTFLKWCLKEQRALDAFVLYNEIEKLGFAASIDSDIYSIMMDELITKSHLLEASKLAGIMVEKSIRLKAPHIDGVVECLKKAGETELVSHINKVNGS